MARTDVGPADDPHEFAITHNGYALDVMASEQICQFGHGGLGCCRDHRSNHQVARGVVFDLDTFEEGRREVGALCQQGKPPGALGCGLLAERLDKIPFAQHAEHDALHVTDGDGADSMVAEQSGDFRHGIVGMGGYHFTGHDVSSDERHLCLLTLLLRDLRDAAPYYRTESRLPRRHAEDHLRMMRI